MAEAEQIICFKCKRPILPGQKRFTLKQGPIHVEPCLRRSSNKALYIAASPLNSCIVDDSKQLKDHSYLIGKKPLR